jgi:hypothetical protein
MAFRLLLALLARIKIKPQLGRRYIPRVCRCENSAYPDRPSYRVLPVGRINARNRELIYLVNPNGGVNKGPIAYQLSAMFSTVSTSA